MNKQNQIEIKLANKTLIVKKLPLKRYALLLNSFKKLPQLLKSFEVQDTATLIEKLPQIIADFYPEFVVMMAIATDLTEDEINSDDFGLDDAVNIVLAVIEVNNYSEIYEQIKKKTTSL